MVLGKAENVATVMQHARICLAPLRFGAGIKTKLAEAMLYGTPNITTSIGAEGMHDGLPWSGRICDSAEAIADQAVNLYQQQPLWQQCQQYGKQIVAKHFHAKENGDALINRIRQHYQTLQHHRQNNFTGMMLRAHHQRSTEFMSRWIEAKNRLQNYQGTAD